jgi:hypothetical protein
MKRAKMPPIILEPSLERELAIDAVTDRVLGSLARRCDEHRPGTSRSWCYSCSEWCYDVEDLAMKCTGCAVRGLIRLRTFPNETPNGTKATP